MRVFNLTDVATEVLERYGLVNSSHAVAGVLLRPGKSVDVVDDASTRARLKRLVERGALSIDEVPASYKVADTVPPATLPAPVAPAEPEVAEPVVEEVAAAEVEEEPLPEAEPSSDEPKTSRHQRRRKKREG